MLQFLALLFVSSAALGAETAPSPRVILNLLDYVAADYSGAVSHGKVLSAAEYKEQMEFSESALEMSEKISETRASASLKAKLIHLHELIVSRAEVNSVSKQAQDAKLQVIALTQIQTAPIVWPSLKRGQKLYAENCATCHGAQGRGDGPAGLALNPRPYNFHNEKAQAISPFQAFNAIRSGVPGTAMIAWNNFTDVDVWDLSFWVLALRHEGEKTAPLEKSKIEAALTEVSTHADTELFRDQNPEDRASLIAAVRLYSKDESADTLAFAKANLKDAFEDYKKGDYDGAKTKALKAYLEGVEPAEPRLKANDPRFTGELENRMGLVRGMMESRKPETEVEASLSAALESLDEAQLLLAKKATSPWLTFLIAAGILLREGFEAVLILVALLAVIRSSGSKKAAAWVHGGWITAVAGGVLMWFFSGWLIGISGAAREFVEAITAIFAVAVLLYMGFWLHSKTEVHRWKIFIDQQVRNALEGSNLLGLAFIAFMAVFREAFETVLFLRATWIEGSEVEKTGLMAGVFSSFALLMVCAWLLVRFSAKIPIRKVFAASSGLMILLSVILIGKGIHSLQETGVSSVNAVSFNFRSEVFGIYPTRETLLAQIVVLIVSIALWNLGKRPPRKRVALKLSS